MSLRVLRFVALLVVCTVTLTGCFGSSLSQHAEDSHGTLSMAMDLAPLTDQAVQVGRVAVTLTHSSGTVITDDLTIGSQSATGTFSNLPIGKWSVVVSVFDATDSLLGTGSTTANVQANATTTANLAVKLSVGMGSMVINVIWKWPPKDLIAFERADSDGSVIEVMYSDGSSQKAITATNSNSTWPAFSPDGSQIAYVSGGFQIAVIDRHGGSQHKFTSSFHAVKSPTWTSDGRRIAYIEGTNTIKIVDADGTNEETLFTVTDPDGRVSLGGVALSPDGNHLAYSKQVLTDANDTSQYLTSIEITDMEGNQVGSIDAPNRALLGPPHWSSDGNELVYARNATGAWNVWKADATGGSQNQLTSATGYSDRGPVFSQDGQQIFFVSEQDGSGEIYAINADGTGSKRVTHFDTDVKLGRLSTTALQLLRQIGGE